MPVEIKELRLKLKVNDESRKYPNGAQTMGTCSQSASRDEALIQACVDRVLKIIDQKTQR